MRIGRSEYLVQQTDLFRYVVSYNIDVFILSKFTHTLYKKHCTWCFHGFFVCQISFVNNVNTLKGGSHVKYVLAQVEEFLVDSALRLHKKKISGKMIRRNVQLFVNISIVNPTFNSQGKEFLTTKVRRIRWCYFPRTTLTSSTPFVNIYDPVISFLLGKKPQFFNCLLSRLTNKLTDACSMKNFWARLQNIPEY